MQKNYKNCDSERTKLQNWMKLVLWIPIVWLGYCDIDFLSFAITFLLWVWNFKCLKESIKMPKNHKNCDSKSAKLQNWMKLVMWIPIMCLGYYNIDFLSFTVAFVSWVHNFKCLKESKIMPKNYKNCDSESTKLQNSMKLFLWILIVC
jgi:hypothetical protein